MKKTFIICIILCSVSSCNFDTYNGSYKYGSVNLLSNEDLINEIDLYVKENLIYGDNKGYVDLTISRSKPSPFISPMLELGEEDQTSIIMASGLVRIDYDQIYPPSYYTLVNGVPVLCYSGIESLIHFDPKYIKRFEKFLKPYLMTDDETKLEKGESPAPNYNPVVVELILENGKIVKRTPVN